MSFVLYSTLTRQKEIFVPMQPPKVSIYVCGPTVYELLHVGNFRGPLVTSMLRNWLVHLGYQVTFAQNFTDVDDKIINRARELGKDSAQFAEHFIEEYKKDFASLGLQPHDLNPKVTETMPDIISLIAKLIESKKAYVAGSDVLYAVRSFDGYGKLSGRKIDELESGARVEVDEKKNDPLDFALWKGAKPGEPSWPSPWGPGRPGWHIECSAMVCKHFGDAIDIHAGGSDLMFPHHENEIAQSEGASRKQLAKYWLHWSMLNFAGQKMSKSLGNIVSLREFIQNNNSEIYKWMILSAHYRTISDFSDEAIERAVSSLGRIYSALAMAEGVKGASAVDESLAPKGFADSIHQAWSRVEEAFNDDLNTPEVFAAVFEVVRIFNGAVKRGGKVTPAQQAQSLLFTEFMQKVGAILSMFQKNASEFLIELDDMLLHKLGQERSVIDAIVQERLAARLAKDFARSDELRAKLTAMHISVSDMPDGSHWEVMK